MAVQTSEQLPAFVRTPRYLAVALDGIRFTDADAAGLRPALWVDAFRTAVSNGRGVSLEARACIQENLSHSTA